MKKSIFLCACTAIALCISSCIRDELQKPEIGSTGFGIMVGGKIDPAQNFNTASTGSVQVKVDGESIVRVYTNSGKGVLRLVAEKSVSGNGSVNFDMQPGTKSLTVVNMKDGNFANLPLNGTADFTQTAASQTRTTHEGNTGLFNVTLLGNGNGEYLKYNYDQAKSDVYSDGFKDVKNATALYYTKNGKFTLYPIWYTSESSGENVTMGIYYYENNEMKTIPVFTNDKMDGMTKFYTGSEWLPYSDAHTGSLDGYENLDRSTDKNVMGRGIQVTCPAHTVFGFYIDGGNDHKWSACYYSESKYCMSPSWGIYENPGNKDGQKSYVGDELGKYGHVALINVEGRKYLAFDDWCEMSPHSYTNPEYWHMVFQFDGNLSAVPAEEDDDDSKIDGEDGSWILACEDLGELSDYDFNDVVLKITHLAGADSASVTLLAAGGTLKSHVFFGNQDLGEVHELFGAPDTISINTWQQLNYWTPYSVKIAVPQDFTMTSENMGGFKIVRNDIAGVVAAPDMGQVPYMICVPDTWKWPREMKKIVDAYPSFAGWCNDHTKNTDWYENAVDSLVYSK